MTKLLAARFTTNLRNKLQRRGASSKKAHSIGMKTFKLNKEVMIDDHLLLRVLNPRLLQKRTTRRELTFIILIVLYNHTCKREQRGES